MTFSPDGTQLAAAGPDLTIKLLDVASGRELQTFKGHSNNLDGVAFHPDGRHVASVGEENWIRVWNVASGAEIWRFDRKAGVYGLTYSPDGKWLAAAAWNFVLIFDSETGEERCRLGRLLTPVGVDAFSPDSQVLLGTDDTMIKLWEIPSGRSKGGNGGLQGVD